MVTISDFRALITQKHLALELKNPYVVQVKNTSEGFDLAKEMLYQVCDKKTLLLLSGGKTPKEFYHLLAKEEKLMAGAVGLIDERYGTKMHEDSNEWMIRRSGLLGYVEYRKIPFYSVLHPNPAFIETPGQILSQVQDDQFTLEELADAYDQTLRTLMQNFSQSIGIVGVGLDGHTAGIPVGHIESPSEKSLLVTSFTNFPGKLNKRISMTYFGLSMLDILIVLVFGEEKRPALEKLFEQGSEKEIPARFFKRDNIASKTLIITDQQI